MQLDLLNSNAQKGAFCLDELQAWNWGTFHQRYVKMRLSGKAGLLTGANGSGKSTLVDALLTLIVPPQKRIYNLASGESKKKERTEKSYVLGSYGKQREELEAVTEKYLRGKDDYSVIVARFEDIEHGASVSLAQIFWFENDKLERLYIVANRPLDIRANLDLGSFKSTRAFRKFLREDLKVDIFDSFSDYAEKFRKLLTIKSEKALALFGQTVAVKEIGNLNEFLRNHALEQEDFRERIELLKENYFNLTQAYQAIQKAILQLEKLRPIVSYGKDLDDVLLEGNLISIEKSALPGFFASKSLPLLDYASEQSRLQIKELDLRLDHEDQRREDLANREISIRSQIQSDSAGSRLQQIEHELRLRVKNLEQYATRLNSYLNISRKLKFDDGKPLTLDSFLHVRKELEIKLEQTNSLLLSLRERRDELIPTQRNLKDKLDLYQSEIASLAKRKSQIPDQQIRMRSMIALDLSIPEEQLPFAGELIRVKSMEAVWEPALERLLHGFALRMLVPKEHYQRVNRYVNSTNLKGRLVYYLAEERKNQFVRELDRNSVPRKLDIKSDRIFESWLRRELDESFDYVCSDDEVTFERETRAITKSGLIKGGRALHEKDDRKVIGDRQHYVLGWDNREKISSLLALAEKLEVELKSLDRDRLLLESEEKDSIETVSLINQLRQFESFSDLDFESEKLSVASLEYERLELQTNSLELRKLHQSLEEILQELKESQLRRDQVISARTREEGIKERVAEQSEQCNQIISELTEELKESFPRLEIKVREEVSLKNSDELQQQTNNLLEKELARLHRKSKDLEISLTNGMQDFVRTFTEISSDLDPTYQGLPDFRKLLSRLERDDLPKYEKRFRELLKEKVTHDIAAFKGRLEEWEQQIHDRVEELNSALSSIDYSPSTFIEINCEGTLDVEIRDFRNLLRDCLPDIGGSSEFSALEESFKKVSQLIKSLTDEARWAQKVTDVRNWVSFSASERYRTDGAEKNHYSDSAGLSGGQKAKLAYTILASSIAYQYGIGQSDRSFRFVVVDEAFSRIDEMNARYAMNLFQNLGLQLLVVNPTDKVHIAENFVTSFHLATNSQEGNDSQLVSMTKEEFLLEKELHSQDFASKIQ